MSQPLQPSIELCNLEKNYANQIIFQQLNYRWQGHGVFVLSGANGAGKSTLLKMIVGMESLSAGQVLVNGQQYKQHELAQYISFVPDAMVAYPFITGRDFLEFIASIRGLTFQYAEELIHAFGIAAFLDTRFDAMSFGTAKKFMLISAFISDTPILIFDEPTHGLDAKSLQVFESLLKQVAKEKLILMTCHDIHLQQQLQAVRINLHDLIGEAA